MDPAGNAYVAGNTNGFGVPATPGAFRTDGTGAFVAKVNASGTGLAYLTFLGALVAVPPNPPGTQPGTTAYAVATAGNAYLAGSTFDGTFPATASAFQTKLSDGGPDAFVAKLNPTGSAWSGRHSLVEWAAIRRKRSQSI